MRSGSRVPSIAFVLAAVLTLVSVAIFSNLAFSAQNISSAITSPPVSSSISDDSPDWRAIDAEAMEYFRRYVQFDTTNPPSNTAAAIHYLKTILEHEGIETETFESKPGMVSLVARIPGVISERPLLMMSHADVVPAVAAEWKRPPFSADIDHGYVWGRGTIDNKAHGIMALMTMLALKREGVILRRGVELMVSPDEEAGGESGTKWMVDHHFESIDPAFAINEGGAGGVDPFGSGASGFGIAVAEKTPLWLHLTAKGKSGHASIPNADNPNLIMVNGLSRLMAMAAQRPSFLEPIVARNLSATAAYEPFPTSFELGHLNWPFMMDIASRGPLSAPDLQASFRDTVSITIITAGNKVNVIPSTAEADVDCRLLPDTNPAGFMRDVRAVLGSRISVEARLTPIAAKPSPASGELWDTIERVVGKDFRGMGLAPSMTSAVTDSRFLRAHGVPTYGFIPIVLTPDDERTVHGVDERLSIENFDRGIRATYDLAKDLCVDKASTLTAAAR